MFITRYAYNLTNKCAFVSKTQSLSQHKSDYNEFEIALSYIMI